MGAHCVGDGQQQVDWLLTDSRSLCFPETTLFFALQTSRGDGRHYIPELYRRGVRSFVVTSIPSGDYPEASFLVVPNTLQALQRLAERHRDSFDIPVIGITGSNGKTTVKEWLYQLLSPERVVTRSPRSYNSQIGVPLSVWSLNEQSQLAIFEAGISQPGEMAALQRIIQPTIGVFTCLGAAHQENFQSMEEKCREKMLLFRDAQVIIYPDGDPLVSRILAESDYSGKLIAWHSSGDAMQDNRNVCAAVCRLLGMDEDTLQQRLEGLEPVAMRLEVRQAERGCTLINDALGDGGYNDLIYQGVEQAAKEYGLRTMQLSPVTREEGLAYLQTVFQQMEAAQDTVRRLFIVAATSYDDYLRQNNNRLEKNDYADLLYLETSTPLNGKGYTLYLPFYGAMYEAGAVAPVIAPEVLLVAANPEIESVKEAVEAFTEGFRTDYVAADDDRQLVIQYLSDGVSGGFAVADTTAMRLLYQHDWQTWSQLMVPVCGGAGSTFRRLIEIMGGYDYVGVDATVTSPHCPFSAVKHIDRAVALCIGQWLSAEGMPKHQVLGLADGYTELVVHPYTNSHKQAFSEQLTEALRTKIYNDAVRKEAEHEK